MSRPTPESTMRSQSKGIGSADNSASIRCNLHTISALLHRVLFVRKDRPPAPHDGPPAAEPSVLPSASTSASYSALVVAEVALSFVLLLGAALMIKSLASRAPSSTGSP